MYPEVKRLLEERPGLTVKLVAGNLHIGEVRAERLINEFNKFDAKKAGRDNTKGKTKVPGKNPLGKGGNPNVMNAAAEALGG